MQNDSLKKKGRCKNVAVKQRLLRQSLTKKGVLRTKFRRVV